MKVYLVYMMTVMDGPTLLAFETLLRLFSTRSQATEYIVACKDIDKLNNSVRRATITYRIVTEKVMTDYVRTTPLP
jgi:cysteinyl-tRNA synthetase